MWQQGNTLLMLENACESDLDKQPPLPSGRAWPPKCLHAGGPGPRSPDLISRWDLEKELVNLPLEQVPLYAVVPVGAPVNSIWLRMSLGFMMKLHDAWLLEHSADLRIFPCLAEINF